MAGSASSIEVEGLPELLRALKGMEKDIAREFKWELEEAANPVKLGAQTKAFGALTNMRFSPEWARMRVGVSSRDVSVWVAPELRGGRGGSPGGKAVFKEAIQTRALNPALAENATKVEKNIDDMVDRIARRNGF